MQRPRRAATTSSEAKEYSEVLCASQTEGLDVDYKHQGVM